MIRKPEHRETPYHEDVLSPDEAWSCKWNPVPCVVGVLIGLFRTRIQYMNLRRTEPTFGLHNRRSRSRSRSRSLIRSRRIQRLRFVPRNGPS
jgi:hypothetical protein